MLPPYHVTMITMYENIYFKSIIEIPFPLLTSYMASGKGLSPSASVISSIKWG